LAKIKAKGTEQPQGPGPHRVCFSAHASGKRKVVFVGWGGSRPRRVGRQVIPRPNVGPLWKSFSQGNRARTPKRLVPETAIRRPPPAPPETGKPRRDHRPPTARSLSFPPPLPPPFFHRPPPPIIPFFFFSNVAPPVPRSGSMGPRPHTLQTKPFRGGEPFPPHFCGCPPLGRHGPSMAGKNKKPRRPPESIRGEEINPRPPGKKPDSPLDGNPPLWRNFKGQKAPRPPRPKKGPKPFPLAKPPAFPRKEARRTIGQKSKGPPNGGVGAPPQGGFPSPAEKIRPPDPPSSARPPKNRNPRAPSPRPVKATSVQPPVNKKPEVKRKRGTDPTKKPNPRKNRPGRTPADHRPWVATQGKRVGSPKSSPARRRGPIF